MFQEALRLRMCNLARAIKADARCARDAIPEVIPAVLNLANAHHAVDGRRAAAAQPLHALAFLPFLDAAVSRQLLVQAHSDAEGAGRECGPALEFDDKALQLLDLAANRGASESAEVAAMGADDGTSATMGEARISLRACRKYQCHAFVDQARSIAFFLARS
jgi:hypothetical protein